MARFYATAQMMPIPCVRGESRDPQNALTQRTILKTGLTRLRFFRRGATFELEVERHRNRLAQGTRRPLP
jgi:hypothetical protein